MRESTLSLGPRSEAPRSTERPGHWAPTVQLLCLIGDFRGNVAPVPWSYTLHLPQDPRAPGVARATLQAVLGAHGFAGVGDTLQLLASELVTNALLHSGGPYGLRVKVVAPDRVRLRVWDSNPEVPAPFKGVLEAADVGAECGPVRLGWEPRAVVKAGCAEIAR